MGPGTLASSSIKLEKPEKYDGDAQKLANWMLNIQQFCEVAGVMQMMEIIKMAVTLLTGKAFNLVEVCSEQQLSQIGHMYMVGFLPRFGNQAP